MDIGMTMDELAARLPFERYIPITEAAQILGGGDNRIKSLMEFAMTNGVSLGSHSCPYHPVERTFIKIGLAYELPILTPDTDPSTVTIKSDEVLRRWCLELETLLYSVVNGDLAPRHKVEARFAALNSRAYELKTGSKPTPVDSADSGTTAPVSRWPWGNHHTEALGHLEAAALRFWGSNYDPNDPATAPTNEQVSEWLHKQRKVSKTLSNAMASILRLDGLKTGPRK